MSRHDFRDLLQFLVHKRKGQPQPDSSTAHRCMLWLVDVQRWILQLRLKINRGSLVGIEDGTKGEEGVVGLGEDEQRGEREGGSGLGKERKIGRGREGARARERPFRMGERGGLPREKGREGIGDGETHRQTRRDRDRERERARAREGERERERERETESQRDRETETEGQNDREAERNRESDTDRVRVR